jgi:hypothetical protein
MIITSGFEMTAVSIASSLSVTARRSFSGCLTPIHNFGLLSETPQ